MTDLDLVGLGNAVPTRLGAIEILEQKIADASVSGVHLFFPDPWHKRRHHKRRIVRPSFLELLNRKLRPGGYFHAATDWQDYAEQALEACSALPVPPDLVWPLLEAEDDRPETEQQVLQAVEDGALEGRGDLEPLT